MNKNNIVYIVLGCLIISFFTVLLFKTRGPFLYELGPTTTEEAISYIKVLNLKKEELHKEKKDLEFKKVQLSAAYLEKGDLIESLYSEISLLNGYLGNVDVRGQGVKIILYPPEGYLVSVEIMLELINDLWSSGVDAMSINGKRVSWNTYFSIIESELYVNEEKIIEPYIIEAIGPQDVIIGTLNMPGGVIEKMQIREINVEIIKNQMIVLASRRE